MKKQIPVLLDTDIGTDIDDSWSLDMLLNCPELDLKLVTCSTGDVVYRAKLAARFLELTQIAPIPDWLIADKEHFSGTVSRIPTREEIAPIVNEQLIVELYSR